MMENAVSVFKWMTFVVTNNHDGDYLKANMRQFNVDISVIDEQSNGDLNKQLKSARDELTRNCQGISNQIGLQGLVSSSWISFAKYVYCVCCS